MPQVKQNILKLETLERLVVSNIMPKEDTMLNMVLQKEIATKAMLSAEELTTIGYKEVEGGVKAEWNKLPIKEVMLSSAEITYLQGAIKALDAQKKITAEIFNVCDKILKLED